MRTPKVPVRVQRHRAWDPFLDTSSQSRAVHTPCWSSLRPRAVRPTSGSEEGPIAGQG